MEWKHRIDAGIDGQCTVTFIVQVQGLTALLLLPIMRHILGRELPATVDRLTSLALQGR